MYSISHYGDYTIKAYTVNASHWRWVILLNTVELYSSLDCNTKVWDSAELATANAELYIDNL